MSNKKSINTRKNQLFSFAAVSLSALILAACGGGGVTSSGSSGGSSGGGATVTASPYVLFASSYIAYAAQTNGAYLHSAQNGDVYTGFGGNLTYGNYSSSQADMNRTGLYTLQTQATAAATAAGDYMYVAVTAPGNATVDISQAATLLIQMGNTYTPSSTGGHASVFTVDINNGSGTKAATGDCSYNQTLAVVGNNVSLTALGARTYAIPLSSFTCTTGTLATLQSSGITTVAVKIVGSNNPSIVNGEYDTIALGMIGFTGSMTSANVTSLNTL